MLLFIVTKKRELKDYDHRADTELRAVVVHVFSVYFVYLMKLLRLFYIRVGSHASLCLYFVRL